MFRILSFISFLLLTGLDTKAQIEVFRTVSDELSLQLVISPGQPMAAVTWNRGNKPGFALLNLTVGDDGSLSLQQHSGHVLLEGRNRDGMMDIRLNAGGEAIGAVLKPASTGKLSGWRFLRAEGSFRHHSDHGSGAIIELNYLFPDDQNPLMEMLTAYYGLDAQGGSPEGMMQADITAYLDRYRQMSTASEGNTLEMNWMKSATSLPVFISDHLVGLVKLSVVSAGQQSVRTHHDFALIDTRDNRRLLFDDIFEPDCKEALAALLGVALREQFNLDSNLSLRQAGFFSDAVHPGSNIVLGAGSIGFAYNVYELGPPAKGQPVLMLPLTAVEPYLKHSFKTLLR